ncbi:hypothetical protein FFK22_009305 [Mycobacterium sp. KBS0706]|uniref:hypothetical protein n=1 Tax=Mycobacterium sp. KBS0706 TaxID=2578109 RepID=UPI00110FA02C|nr:hypothetical protein [Mycobacterium sp. KBS0706]TSD88910.1 hypothetical protein FFK22_009305 [Mycobacterium sp. KBS0706]
MKTNWQASAVLAAVTLVASCSIQRAETASTAQKQMVGMSRERVLACMGVPAARLAEGSTEVWTYGSGGRTDTFAAGTSTTTASAMAYSSGVATGFATTNSFGSSSTRARYCVVNVVMIGGQVSAVNYAGPTGGLLTRGEQCAYAVQNCVQ